MKRCSWFLLAPAVLIGLAAGSSAHADLFAPGATLDVTYEDPTTGTRQTETVPFQPNGASSPLDGGVLSISEQTLVVNPTTEWVQFNLSTTRGGPLTFPGEFFFVNLNNVQLTERAGWIDNYNAFTLNGQTSGDPFLDPLILDPVTPSVGDVAHKGPYPIGAPPIFDGTVFFPNPPAAFYIFANPVGVFLSAWGVDPNVNGYLAGVELQANPVPEPSTLALGTVGLLGLASVVWRRRRQVA